MAENEKRMKEIPLSFNPRASLGAASMNVPGLKRRFDRPPTPTPLSLSPKFSMGQTTEAAPVPAEEPVPQGTCPAALEMPDGRVLNPDDPITTKDLCTILSKFAQVVEDETFKKVEPLTHRGGFVASGGGGGTGQRGPAGPPGTIGLDFVSKTDGDFTAGAGPFIPVPGTLLNFSLSQAGNVLFLVQATYGNQLAWNGQIGILVDALQFPLNTSVLPPPPAEIFVPGTAIYPMNLAAGPHTVQVLLRGLVLGEQAGAGQGSPARVAASINNPLVMVALHS